MFEDDKPTWEESTSGGDLIGLAAILLLLIGGFGLVLLLLY